MPFALVVLAQDEERRLQQWATHTQPVVMLEHRLAAPRSRPQAQGVPTGAACGDVYVMKKGTQPNETVFD